MKYPINPVAKPRMTRSDRWKKRPATERYWHFKDDVRAWGVKLPLSGAHVIFSIPMPKSWSKKRKKIYDGQPHRHRADLDNFLKALCDAVYDEDSGIWDIRVTKLWAVEGSIEIKK